VNGNKTVYNNGLYSASGNGWPEAREGHTVALLNNDTILVFGGYIYIFPLETNAWNGLSDLWRYEPLTNKWYLVLGNASLSQPSYYDSNGIGLPANRYSSSLSLLSNNTLVLYSGYTWPYAENINDMWLLKQCECENGFCSLDESPSCLSCTGDYIGPYCNQTCACDNGVCGTGVNATDQCLSCYGTVTYGLYCNETCYCVNGYCSYGINGTGGCATCIYNYFGTLCDQECSTCIHGYCDISNKFCRCYENWNGTYCNISSDTESSESSNSESNPSTGSSESSNSGSQTSNSGSKPSTGSNTGTGSSQSSNSTKPNTLTGTSVRTESSEAFKIDSTLLLFSLCFIWIIYN